VQRAANRESYPLVAMPSAGVAILTLVFRSILSGRRFYTSMCSSHSLTGKGAQILCT